MMVTVLVLRRCYVEGGAGPICDSEFLCYGYCVVSVGSTYNNSSISHTGAETAASTRRGLTPILFLLCGAKHTVRGATQQATFFFAGEFRQGHICWI